jgi:hypothetical protein
MKIAFITCARKPDITADDDVLAGFLIEQGCSVQGIPWDTVNIRWNKFDLLVLRSCWDYHLRADEFTRWIEFIKGNNIPLLNTPDIVRWNMNKQYLFELELQGVTIPDGVLIAKNASAQTVSRAIGMIYGDKLVVKPAVSATAFQTQVVTRERLVEDQSVISSLFGHGDVIVQKFMDEITTAGEISMIYFGRQFSHAVLKQARPGDFRVQTEFGGTVRGFSPGTNLLRQTDSIMEKIPECLYARVDGLEVNGKFILMELELIEPVLFFQQFPGAAQRMGRAVLKSPAAGDAIC